MEVQELSEDALIAMEEKFSGEIDSLEEALASVKEENPNNESVVEEIGAAVEKSRLVLTDLQEALHAYREAAEEGREFTVEENDLFKYFGFNITMNDIEQSQSQSPSGRRSASSAGVHLGWAESVGSEPETNVHDIYQTRPSPEAPPEVVESWKQREANHDKAKFEVIVQQEVERRLSNLMSEAEAQLHKRNEMLISQKLEELQDEAKPMVADSCCQTIDDGHNQSDLADLIGVDAPDQLEAKINDLVSHRVRMELTKQQNKVDTRDQHYKSENVKLQETLRLLKDENGGLRESNERLLDELTHQKLQQAANTEQAGSLFSELTNITSDLEQQTKAKATQLAADLSISEYDRENVLSQFHEVIADQQSSKSEADKLRGELLSTRETFKREITNLGGQLEVVVKDGTSQKSTISHARDVLNRVLRELSVKSFEYNPPESQGVEGLNEETAIDNAVAQALSVVQCPISIDCHKVAPSEYYLDRRVHVKLVNDLAYVRKPGHTNYEKLTDYLKRLYAPFMVDYDTLKNQTALRNKSNQQLQQVPQQVQQIQGRTYSDLHRSRSNSVGQQQQHQHQQQQQQQVLPERSASPETGDMLKSTLRELFQLTDKNMIGLVTKQQMIRGLRRYPNVASQLRMVTGLTQNHALETFIQEIPGTTDREMTWADFSPYFTEARHIHRSVSAINMSLPLNSPVDSSEQQQSSNNTINNSHVHHNIVSHIPASHSSQPTPANPPILQSVPEVEFVQPHNAKGFNERLQARQTEMTRELLHDAHQRQVFINFSFFSVVKKQT